MMRTNRAFMAGVLPALEALGLPAFERFGSHARSSFTALVIHLETRKPTRLMVGRLHYSLSSTLSAQFRWCFGASERLDSAS